jgi:hypothetical protein
MKVSNINNNPKQTRVIRYCGTIASSTKFSRNDLLQFIVAVTSGSTTAIELVDAIRLDLVKVWLLPNSDTGAGVFALEWTGDRTPNTIHTTAFAPAIGSCMTSVPPKDSLAHFWSCRSGSDNGEYLFILDPSNSTVEIILDLHVTYLLGNGSTDTSTLGSASSINGVAYLTQPVNTSGELTPVGVVSASL